MKHAANKTAQRSIAQQSFTNIHSDTTRRQALIPRVLELVRMDPIKKIISSELRFAY
jgi:hypothetical protein